MKKLESKDEIKTEIVIDLFNQKADTWSKKYSSVFSPRLSAFESVLKSIKGDHKTLLDVGCATGDMLKMAHNLGFDVYGIDISPQMVDICKKNLCSLIPDNKIICAALENNPLEFSKFDVIICSSLFEYLNNPEIYLELFHKLLTVNGTVLITIPNTKSMFRIYEYFLNILFNLFPFLNHINPKVSGFYNYIKLSKNRPNEDHFCRIVSTKNLIPKMKLYIGRNKFDVHNDFFKSNLVLYLLEKKN